MPRKNQKLKFLGHPSTAVDVSFEYTCPMKTEQQRASQNIGRLHAVKCEWCDLKMACNCLFDDCRQDPETAHPLVMCPRCQVTEFLNLLFGGAGRKPHQSSSGEDS